MVHLQHWPEPTETECVQSQFARHYDRLEDTIKNNAAVSQDAYAGLHEIISSAKCSEIPEQSIQEAREDMRRLNLKKVRYEDLVEAFQRRETKLGKEELKELRDLVGVFDENNDELLSKVGRAIGVKSPLHGAIKRQREEKRKGVVRRRFETTKEEFEKDLEVCVKASRLISNGGSERLGSEETTWI